MNNSALLQIRKLQTGENKYCFECKSASPTWASLPYGIYLCYNCSGLHRGMGVHLTFVRSIEMDAWTDKQLAMMYQGGNQQLRTFFESHGIQISDSNKWKTNAAHYYRERMKSLIGDTPLPQEPQNWSDLYETPIYKPQQQQVPQQPQPQQTNFWEQAQKSTKEAITKFDEKIQKIQFKEEASQFGQQIGTKTKEFGENASKIADKAFKSIKTGFNDAFGFIKSKADQVIGKEKDKQFEQTMEIHIQENNIQQVQQQNIPQQQPKQPELYQFQDFDALQQQQQQTIKQQPIDLIDYQEYFEEGPQSVIIYEHPKYQQQQQQNLMDIDNKQTNNNQQTTTPNLLDL